MTGTREHGNWYPVYRCVACKRSLSDHEKMFALICPGCGLAADCTILHTENGRARGTWRRNWLGFEVEREIEVIWEVR